MKHVQFPSTIVKSFNISAGCDLLAEHAYSKRSLEADLGGKSTRYLENYNRHRQLFMDSATELPSSLVRQMNSAASITTLNTYRTGVGKDALGGALNIEAQYDRQSARFVSRLPSAYVFRFFGLPILWNIHSGSLTYLRELQHIIENYKSLNGNDYFWANFDPDTCTWHQVQNELNKVEDEYQLKGKRNHIRRAFRGEGLTRNLTPLLEGIPENDGLGLLKGGLIILFNAGTTLCYLVPSFTYKHPTSRPLKTGLGLAKRFLIAFVKFQIYLEVHMKP